VVIHPIVSVNKLTLIDITGLPMVSYPVVRWRRKW